MAAVKSLSFDSSIIKPSLGPRDNSTWYSSNHKHGTSKVVEYVGTAKMIDAMFAAIENVSSLHFA